MADRCHACGGWLQPADTHCATCQTPVRGDARDDDVDPFDDEPGGGDPLDTPLAGPLIELDVSGPALGPAGVAVGVDLDVAVETLGALEAGPALELDVSGPGVAAAPHDAGQTPARRPASGAPLSLSAEPDPARVAEVAGYGQPPTGLVSAVTYAIGVMTRRPALRAAHAEARRKRAVAARKADEALVALGEALYAKKDALDLSAAGEALHAVDRAKESASARGQEKAQAEADAEARRQELSRDLGRAEAETNPFRDRETKLRTLLEARQHDKKRAAAQEKRAEIEIRNATEAGDRARVEMLSSERDARAAEVKLADEKIRELTEELGQVRRELASRVGRVAALTEEQRQAEHTLRRATGLYGAGAAEAARRLEDALRTFAEHAVARRLSSAEPALLEKVEKARQAVEARTAEEKLYARAEDSWDRPGFWRGASVLGVASALVLAMIVVAATL